MNFLFGAGNPRGLDHEYDRLCAQENARNDTRSSEAAVLLCLAQAGVEVSDASITTMIKNLHELAVDHRLCPDEVQDVLETHEPSLKLLPAE